MDDKMPEAPAAENTNDQQPENAEAKAGDNSRKVKDLLVFKSPSRPPVVMDRELTAFSVSVAFLLSIIAAFFGEYIAILLIWAVLFFIIALSKRPPEDVEHKITTEGITSIDHVYLWEELGPFWFTKKSGYTVLQIIQRGSRFGTLIIVLPHDLEEEKVRDTIAKYLSFIETPEKTRTDRLTEWFAGKITKAKSSM